MLSQALSGTHLSSCRMPPWTRPTTILPVSWTGTVIAQRPSSHAPATNAKTATSEPRRHAILPSSAARASSDDTATTRNETPYTAVIEAIWMNGSCACWL